jgi:hypothetical protein
MKQQHRVIPPRYHRYSFPIDVRLYCCGDFAEVDSPDGTAGYAAQTPLDQHCTAATPYQ